MLPLWYTMFYEHERYGTPVMRPMLTEYPLDRKVYALDDQYLLSDKLLVRPVMAKGVNRVNVTFPSTDGNQAGDLWYDTDNYYKIDSVGVHSIVVDIMKIPVYQKGGTIIPKKETIQKSSVYMTNDPISLYIAVDKDNQAQGTLFIDDEKSYDYRQSKYLYLQLDFVKDTLTSKHIDKNTDFESESKLEKVVFAGINTAPAYATLKTSDGQSKRLEIVEFTQNYFVIDKPDVTFREEWTITFNGGKQNVFCAFLLIFSILLLVKNFKSSF